MPRNNKSLDYTKPCATFLEDRYQGFCGPYRFSISLEGSDVVLRVNINEYCNGVIIRVRRSLKSFHKYHMCFNHLHGQSYGVLKIRRRRDVIYSLSYWKIAISKDDKYEKSR